MPRPTSPEACRGRWLQVVARGSDTVCHEKALFLTALRTMGVPLHPADPFRIEHREDANGEPFTLWVWNVGEQSLTNPYTTEQLAAWWVSDEWLARNPEHEFTKVRTALLNHQVTAEQIRAAVPRIVFERADKMVLIPVNASPARRAWLLGLFDGTIKPGTPFVELDQTQAA